MANQIMPNQSHRFCYLFGNQSSDPDSVFGAVTLSVLLFIHNNKKNQKFKQYANYLFSDEFSLGQLDAILQDKEVQIFMPIVNNENLLWVTSKLEIDFINAHFSIGMEDSTDLGFLNNLRYGQKLRIGIFDFNLLNQKLENSLKRAVNDFDTDIRYEICLDHHDIASKEFLTKFIKTRIHRAGSCHSVLFSYFSGDEIELLAEYCPELVKISALVIKADSNNFAKELKGKRWVETDIKICQRLMSLTTYGSIDEDYHGFVNYKYSEKQFDLDFERLFFADAKRFVYKNGKVVEYAVFFNSVDEYFINYTPEGFFRNVAEVIEKK